MLFIIGAKVSEVELDRGPIMSMSALGHSRPSHSAPPVPTHVRYSPIATKMVGQGKRR
jgi:hypothetical protein